MTEDERLIRNIDEFGVGLNQWEVDFMEDMHKRVLGQKKPMSEGQRKICERIEKQRIA